MRKINLLSNKKAAVGKLLVYFLLTIIILLIVGTFLVLASFKTVLKLYKPQTPEALTKSEAFVTLQSLLETKVTVDTNPDMNIKQESAMTLFELIQLACSISTPNERINYGDQLEKEANQILLATYPDYTYSFSVYDINFPVHYSPLAAAQLITMQIPLPDGTTQQLKFGIMKTAK